MEATAVPRERIAPAAAGEGWTLAVTASATLLVIAVFAAGIMTMGETALSLHTGLAGETWGLSGMSLGLATALLAVGVLADDLGRRRVLVWSAWLLAATSAAAALAPTIEVFVAARVLQGVAGAGVLASSLAAIGHAFPRGQARTRATGVWGAAVGAGIALGPLAGALVTDALDWRSSYWLQAAAAAAIAPAAATLAESRSDRRRPVDLPGVATLGAGMALLTAGLVTGRQSWSDGTAVAMLAGGAVLLAAFAVLELRSRAPMLDLSLVREPTFVASLTGALFTGLGVIGLMSYSPIVFVGGLGVSLLGAAALLAAWSATSAVVSLLARRLPGRLASHSRLAIGLGVGATGELALTGLGAGSSWTRLLPGLAVAGVGSGLANAALGRLAVESVPVDRAGMGSGASNTARYLGGGAGVAVVVAVASAAGGAGTPSDVVAGWNAAAVVCAGLCAVGALVATRCGPR